VRVLHLLDHGDVIQLDVEVLVHALQRAAHGDVVLELDGDLVVHQSLEEAVYRKHIPSACARPSFDDHLKLLVPLRAVKFWVV